MDRAALLSNLALFVVAAVFEIAGCFSFWRWLRGGPSPVPVALGVVCLVAFAVTLARTDAAFAGRAYAAYGGIYIATSLAWLFLIEHQCPTRTDLAGAALAIAGATLIVASAAWRSSAS